jgi:hypothetical protein
MMHPYLPHLLEDIENAKRDCPPEELPFLDSDLDSDLDADSDIELPGFEEEEEDLEADFEEVERYVSGDYETHRFGDYCGLKAEDFPPPEQLSEEDMKLIIEKFKTMSFTWNINYSFPEALPLHLHYKIMINSLSEKTMIAKYGFITFDYCSGSPEGCIFGEYCSCLEYWKEDDLKIS